MRLTGKTRISTSTIQDFHHAHCYHEIGKPIGDNGQIHVFSGANGHKVRVLNDGQWKIVNWRSPDIASALKEKFRIEVWKDDSGNFRAKSPNARVSAVADNSRLALALAALALQ